MADQALRMWKDFKSRLDITKLLHQSLGIDPRVGSDWLTFGPRWEVQPKNDQRKKEKIHQLDINLLVILFEWMAEEVMLIEDDVDGSV